MQSLCEELDTRFQGMARSQDMIGWRRFMEGMISRGIVEIQRDYLQLSGARWKLDRWATGVIIKLLEVTHGQWLYRNVVVHDKVAGSLAVMRKDGIRSEIEDQLSKGEEGLLDEHTFLLEVNLDELHETDGDSQEYWLLAIRAARVACAVRGSDNVQDLPRLRPRDGHDYG
jgi:hypothetical protein